MGFLVVTESGLFLDGSEMLARSSKSVLRLVQMSLALIRCWTLEMALPAWVSSCHSSAWWQ